MPERGIERAKGGGEVVLGDIQGSGVCVCSAG